MAYYQLEPFGAERDDIRQAFTTCILANLFLKKGQKPFKLEDFMINGKNGEKKVMTAKEMEMVCRIMAEKSQGTRR